MSATDSLVFALTIMAAISIMFMGAQLAINNINPEGTQFYDCSNSVLSSAMSAGSCDPDGNFSLNSDVNGRLPTTNAEVNPSTGNIFTDTFTAAKNWIADATGIGYVYDILTAPKTFMVAAGVPNALAIIITAAWYLIILFLIVSWILGR